jgi:hypothetical protein
VIGLLPNVKLSVIEETLRKLNNGGRSDSNVDHESWRWFSGIDDKSSFAEVIAPIPIWDKKRPSSASEELEFYEWMYKVVSLLGTISG